MPALSALAISLLSMLSPVPAANAATPAGEGTIAGADPSGAATPPLAVSLTAVRPTVATPGAPVTIAGTIRNTSRGSIASPVAHARIGQRPLTSRQAVAGWAAGAGQQPLVEVGRAPLGRTLAPGAVTPFILTIPATAISHRESFAILPLAVDVVGAAGGVTKELADTHTFIPTLSAIKAYEPLSIAWLVPLTLDPDPALHGTASAARTAAWARAIGPGSRLDRLIQGTENANVTWAIDPAILGPPQTAAQATDAATAPAPNPSESRAPTRGTTPTPDPVAEATSALARRLRAASPRHTLWSLPYADPDLSALLPLSGNRSLAPLISHPSTLDRTIGPARTDIAWPVEDLTPGSEARLRRAYGSPGLAAAVTSASTLTDRFGSTGGASRRSSSGLPLLAYDRPLSTTLAQTSSRAVGAITVQRFLADSMALLGERPGTRDRSVLVTAPRTFSGDPAVLRSLLTAVAHAPWLTPTTTGQLLVASATSTPDAPPPARAGAATSPAPGGEAPAAADPLTPARSPLTASLLAATAGRLSAIAGIGSILGDGRLFTAPWTDAQAQRLSARWRGHPDGITAIDAATTAALDTIGRGVRVAPTSVNFLADRGVLQVTVVNDLDVPVHDVHLTLTPAQPRLRIERQPDDLKIGARSRANVPLQVTSIAAGLVRVEAVLTTRNGTPLGQNASVDVRVRPPSVWLYRTLGGLAGLVLVLGTYRSLRRGSTRGSRPEAQELPLEDQALHG